MQQGRVWRSALCAIAIFLIHAGPAAALTDEEILRRFQFHFLDVGARSLGMGGARTALGGDAASLEANPAGLHLITAPQFYLEIGSIDDDATSRSGGRGSLSVDSVTGDRDLPFLSLTSAPDPDTVTEPSFIGLSWPFEFGRNSRSLVVSGSRRVVQSLDLTLPSDGAGSEAMFSFDSFPNTIQGDDIVAYAIGAPVSGSVTSEIVTWNLGGSIALHPDFSVGVTVSHATIDLDLETLTTVVDPQQILFSSTHPRLPASPETDVYTTRADGSDSGIAFSLGLHWHPGTTFAGGDSPWQFGITFSKGVELAVEERTELNGEPEGAFENMLIVPDRYAVGGSYAFLERWLVGAAIERIEYSDMLKGFEARVNYLTSALLADGAFAGGVTGPVRYRINDGTVYRAGVEYLYPLAAAGERAIALRGGWYRAPDMAVRMSGFNSTDAALNRAYENSFPSGDAENHFTAGVGLTWGASQAHLAFDGSGEGNRILATFVQQWGGR